MLDLVIRGGTVVDGTGAPGRTADVGIRDGRIASVGESGEAARRELDASGLLVTPGWVDVHTHYDGQVTWDTLLTPSCWHGVTTVVMGIQRMVNVADTTPVWNEVMATAMVAMLPPVFVVVVMQRLFVKGLVETEK